MIVLKQANGKRSVCRLPPRFGACTPPLLLARVFIALSQIVALTGIPVSALYRWMIVREVAEEAIEMMRPAEELEKKFSYSTYLADLRLVNKSPYSAVSNPLVYQWLHAVGSLLLSKRSLNARHLSDNNFNQIFANAAMLAFVRHRSTGFVMSFASTQVKADAEGELLAKPETLRCLACLQPSIWLTGLRGLPRRALYSQPSSTSSSTGR